MTPKQKGITLLSVVLAFILAATYTLAGNRATVQARSSTVTVPDGTPIHVRLDNSLSTKRNHPGDEFTATVTEPLVVDGRTVIPEGARATGIVVDDSRSGRFHGKARISLKLESVEANGTRYDVDTMDDVRRAGSHKKRNWIAIGGGAAGGTVIGAIAAGGTGALIGGPAGAGAGVVYVFVTGRRDVRLPAETPMTFDLDRSFTVQVTS